MLWDLDEPQTIENLHSFMHAEISEEELETQPEFLTLTEEELWAGIELFTQELSTLSPVDQVNVICDQYHIWFAILSNKLKSFLTQLTQISYNTETTWSKIIFETESNSPNSLILEALNEDLNAYTQEFDIVNQHFQLVTKQIAKMNLRYDFMMSIIQEMSDV